MHDDRCALDAGAADGCVGQDGELPFDLVSESRIDGGFHGWDGATVFRLANGEAWEQAAWRCRPLDLASPLVRVWRLDARFLLEVAGIHELVPVRRIG